METVEVSRAQVLRGSAAGLALSMVPMAEAAAPTWVQYVPWVQIHQLGWVL